MAGVEKSRKPPSRARPVSCLFCRSRKLRCSRDVPCTNCVSRGIKCQNEQSSLQSVAMDISATAPIRPSTIQGTFETDVLMRLQRLEDIVIGQSVTPHNPSSSQTDTMPKTSPTSFVRNSERLNRPVISPSSDVDWLEGEISHPVSTNFLTTFDVEFRTCPINLAASKENNPMKCVWLPLHEEAREIVDKYLIDITHLHHVVHAPSVRAMIDDIYDRLNRKAGVRLGDITLLLAMITSTSFFWTDRDTSRYLFVSAKQAHETTPVWLRRTLDLVDLSRRAMSPSIEDIQAIIIAGFVIVNMMGISSQAHYWISSAISLAWQLSLHRIDHPQNGDLDVPPPDSIAAEVARRVWWNLVGTDWQFSAIAGTHKGIYMINPRHMATKKPINGDDEDLVDGMEGVAKPLEEPTSMSYCLQRFRLAELCRELTDSEPFPYAGSGLGNYQRIRDIDEKMIAFIESLPSFFSLDFEADKLNDSDRRRSKPIVAQRYIINCLIHAQRCRLHLPFLVKDRKAEPKYEYSRNACLQAARMVIRTEQQLRSENLPFVLMRLRSSGIIHCVCMGIIALLMDLCLTRSPVVEDDQERHMEILKALSILEETKDQSPFAEGILDSFYSVLQRYNITLVVPEGWTATAAQGRENNTQPSELVPHKVPTPDPASAMADPTLLSFSDLLQEFDVNFDSSMIDWDALFDECGSAASTK